MNRAEAFQVADRRALHASRLARHVAAHVEHEHEPTFDRIELARIVAHRARAASLGAEGIVVSPAEVYADLEATQTEASGLHVDYTLAATNARVPEVLFGQWRAWLDGWTQFRALVLRRFAEYEQSEQTARAAMPAWLAPYLSGGWDPIGRARFMADVQALNTRLEDQKQQLRAWAARYTDATGSAPTSPTRQPQTPPSGQLGPLLPAVADIASSVSTGFIVAAAAGLLAIVLITRSG